MQSQREEASSHGGRRERLVGLPEPLEPTMASVYYARDETSKERGRQAIFSDATSSSPLYNEASLANSSFTFPTTQESFNSFSHHPIVSVYHSHCACIVPFTIARGGSERRLALLCDARLLAIHLQHRL